MFLRKIPILFFFILGLVALFFGAIILSHVYFVAFVPFLAICYNRTSLIGSLWWAAFCGLFIDFFNFSLPFGVNSIIYVIVSLLLYRGKNIFFAEKPIALALFSGLISITLSLGYTIFSIIFFKRGITNFNLFILDLIARAFFDMIYALFWFICPAFIIFKVKRWKERRSF